MMQQNRNTTLIVLTVLLAFASGSPILAADPIGVQELVAMEKKWPEMAAKRTQILLEGRFGARAGGLLNLQKCDLVFRLDAGQRMPRLRHGDNVELVGYLSKTPKQLEFVVQRIAPGSSDVDRLQTAKRSLSKKDPLVWYAYADRAAKRAEFYSDSDLLTEATNMRARGFEIERGNIKSGDGATLRKLAERASSLGLKNEIRLELIHESMRWQWNAEQKKPKPDVDAFLKTL